MVALESSFDLLQNGETTRMTMPNSELKPDSATAETKIDAGLLDEEPDNEIGDTWQAAPNACQKRVAALRAHYEDFETQQPDPDVHRDLKHGWMLPALVNLDLSLWRRWRYWTLCHEHALGNGLLMFQKNADSAKAQPSARKLHVTSTDYTQQILLPEAAIPPIQFLSAPHRATLRMLEAALDCIPTHGSWHTWSGWSYFDYLLEWLLYGQGHKAHCELPTEPAGCEGASDRLYQVFCLDAMVLWPYDYFGDLMAGSSYGRQQGFYPTPHTVCQFMADITCGKERDMRTETVCDPCVGTGRLLLHASNHSLRLYGMDIDATLCKATLVNGYLYAPWLVRPLPWLDRELAGLESAPPQLQKWTEDERAIHDNIAASISEQMVQSAPPEAQAYLKDTEHDRQMQPRLSPLLKRKRIKADPTQGRLAF
jgi:hypothetical protein